MAGLSINCGVGATTFYIMKSFLTHQRTILHSHWRIFTENWDPSWCQLCLQCQHWRLSLWQTLVQPMKMKLVSWQSLVFSVLTFWISDKYIPQITELSSACIMGWHLLGASYALPLKHWGQEKMATISWMTFSIAFYLISTKFSLKFVPKGLINNIPALLQIMA